jgi:hypothetical protein
MGELSKTYATTVKNSAWPPAQMEGMLNAAQKCKIPYFAFGLMNIGKSREVGLNSVEVNVNLNVSVSDLREPVPSDCAGMSKDYKGRGRDRLEATSAALRLAAEEGSREMIDIMRQTCFNS